MDLRALRYFQAVAECGSYSKGSELLRISQPAVSRTVQLLEAELGKPLFKRHGHGVTLTEAGLTLLERSQSLLRQAEQMMADIRQDTVGPSGTVTIAVPSAVGHFLVPALFDRMRAAYPNIFIRFIGGYSGYIHEWLVRGHVDFACLHEPLPQRGLQMRPLLEEEVFLVGHPDCVPREADRFAVCRLPEVPLALPSAFNATRRVLTAMLSQQNGPVHATVEIDDHIITRSVLKRGQALGLLTRGSFAEDLARGELAAVPLDPAMKWTLMLVTSARVPASPVAALVIEELLGTIRDLVASGVWTATPVDVAPTT